MAGNIIPAIATTNAIIAGLIVMEGLKVLQGEIQNCRTVRLILHIKIEVNPKFSNAYKNYTLALIKDSQ